MAFAPMRQKLRLASATDVFRVDGKQREVVLQCEESLFGFIQTVTTVQPMM